jgi:hypothetical protein
MHLALAMAYVPFEMHLAPIWFTFSLRCAWLFMFLLKP